MLHGSLSCPKVRQKNPGWLGYIKDCTTQLYRDYNYNEPLYWDHLDLLPIFRGCNPYF